MRCVNECAFLQKYGTPKKIADLSSINNGDYLKIAYECSLCGLCGAVCAIGIEPTEMFFEMRRKAVSIGIAPLKSHSTILAYEKRGTSKLFICYSIPEKSDTVFFPGCALTGTRPDSTLKIHKYLKDKIPGLGIVLDCCCKPSHDLGMIEHFNGMISKLKKTLLDAGIKKMIVACPNCYKVFLSYGAPLEVKTVYEVLSDLGFAAGRNNTAINVTFHDSCVLRAYGHIHESVRNLAALSGCKVSEMKHSGSKTLCCGEGGSVGFVKPELAENWRIKRKKEVEGRHLFTYCAGCSASFNGSIKSSHILDFILDHEKAANVKYKVSRSPFTYLNRLMVKREIMKLHKKTQAME